MSSAQESNAFWSRYDRGRTSHLELRRHVEALRERNRQLERELATDSSGLRRFWECGCLEEPRVPDGEPCPHCGYNPDDEAPPVLEGLDASLEGAVDSNNPDDHCDTCGRRLLGHAVTFSNCPTCRADGAEG